MIRRATHKDLNQLVVLFDAYRVFYGQRSDKETAKTFLSERISNGESILLVAENPNNELAGFTQLYPLFSSTRMKRLWLLNDLFVAEKYRGNHISVQLIHAAKDFCRRNAGCSLTLETAKSNLIANSLYLNTGFECDDEHNYYEWFCDQE